MASPEQVAFMKSELACSALKMYSGANEEMMRADSVTLSLKNKDSTSFKKDVSKMATSKVTLASSVGNAVGSLEISDMWQTYFLTC